MRRVFYCWISAIVVAGCGSGGEYSPKPAPKVQSASVGPGDEATLLPLKTGNQWVYTIETGSGTNELTLKVSDVATTGGAVIATLIATTGQGQSTPSEWKVDRTGIYQLSESPTRKFDPPQLLVRFPLERGVERKSSLTGPLPAGGEGPMNLAVKYVGIQEADTDMGRLSALAVESATTWQTKDGVASSHAMTWWAPGIGFVRQRQEMLLGQNRFVVVMKLKSYSFK